MSDDLLTSTKQFIPVQPSLVNTQCDLDAEGHCITCSDEAIPVTVLSVDYITGLAQVTVKDKTEEVDVTLVERVEPGDIIMVHGGVAIGHLEEALDE